MDSEILTQCYTSNPKLLQKGAPRRDTFRINLALT